MSKDCLRQVKLTLYMYLQVNKMMHHVHTFVLFFFFYFSWRVTKKVFLNYTDIPWHKMGPQILL